MAPGVIGGYMIVGSSILLVAAVAIAATGGSVGLGTRDVGGILLVLALGLAGLGAGAIGLAGPSPIRGRWLRVGLVTLAVGILSLTASTLVSATMTYDPLESLPVVALLFLGLWTVLGGGIATAVGLLRSHGRPRALGALFLGGLLLAAAAGILSNEVLAKTSADLPWVRVLMTILAAGGALAMLGAWAGVGLLAVSAPRRDRARHP